MNKVLVVEDEAEIQELASVLLGVHGFEVQTCGNGKDALDLLQKNSYSAVVSDINMPGMNGIQLFNRMAERAPMPLFVFTTGFSLDHPKLEHLRLANIQPKIFLKPFSYNDLADYLIKEILLKKTA